VALSCSACHQLADSGPPIGHLRGDQSEAVFGRGDRSITKRGWLVGPWPVYIPRTTADWQLESPCGLPWLGVLRQRCSRRTVTLSTAPRTHSSLTPACSTTTPRSTRPCPPVRALVHLLSFIAFITATIEQFYLLLPLIRAQFYPYST